MSERSERGHTAVGSPTNLAQPDVSWPPSSDILGLLAQVVALRLAVITRYPVGSPTCGEHVHGLDL